MTTKLSYLFKVVSGVMALLLVGRVPGTSNRKSGWLATIHPYETGESKEEGKCMQKSGATSPGTLAGNAASL
jgi:hypothetical protein